MASNKLKDETPAQLAPASVPPLSERRHWKILMAATVLSFVAYQVTRQETYLPASYALCSSEGTNIYTVDENNTSVECVLIHNSRIVDSGDLGALFFLLGHQIEEH